MSAGYEALATKAKAMYGKRIGRQDLERLAAMLTASLVPCNGKFPTLLALITLIRVGEV